ncbi:MAG: MFS transporter [Caldilineaceae bacterium]
MLQLFASLLRAARRPEILAICAVVFLADVTMGFIVPTLSLYAQSLGASLALIGAISGSVNVVSTLVAVPIGLLSDQQGRRRVISVGMFCFALSAILYTVVPNPYWLFPVRVIAGIGSVASFTIATAYIGDIVRHEDRGPAIGLFTTAMGLGFTIGPAIGGLVATYYGYRGSYRLAAVIGLIGMVIAYQALREPKTGTAELSTARAIAITGSLRQRLAALSQHPGLLAACLTNLTGSMIFNVVFSFVPLLAAGLGSNDAAIGSLFAARGLASACSRLPTGLLTTRFGARRLILISMLVSTGIMLGLARANTAALPLLLIFEGISYGMMLTAGHAYLTEQTDNATRGVATGVYGMMGSIGGASGPLLMGFVADWWGLPAVFWCSAALVAVLLLTVLARRGDKVTG